MIQVSWQVVGIVTVAAVSGHVRAADVEAPPPCTEECQLTATKLWRCEEERGVDIARLIEASLRAIEVDGGLTEDQRVQLRAAQTLWQAYRDSSCRFDTSHLSGTPSAMHGVQVCRNAYSEQRLGQLLRYAACLKPQGTCGNGATMYGVLNGAP